MFNQSHTVYITPYIMSLVINGLGGEHTDTHAYRHTDQGNFKKPGVRGRRPHAPGLKMIYGGSYMLPSKVESIL